MQKYRKFKITNAQMSEYMSEAKETLNTIIYSAKSHALNTLKITALWFKVTESNHRGTSTNYQNPLEVLRFLRESKFFVSAEMMQNFEEGYGTLTHETVVQIVQAKHRRKIAKAIGLKKVSAAIFTTCDPKAMLVYEQMGGRFDSFGVWGLTGNDVAKMWYLAGCNNSPKFRMMLAYEIRNNAKHGRSDNHAGCMRFVRKSSSAANTANILRGLDFLNKRSRQNHGFSSKQIEIIGRVTLPLRYALTTNSYERDGMQEKTILNFEYAAEVQHFSKAEKAKLLSPKEAWFFLYGRCPFKGKNMPNANLLGVWQKGASCFTKLAQEFSAKGREDMLLPIFNLSALFGSYGEVKRFVKDWTEKGVHDAGQFSLQGNFTSQKWAGFCHKHPEALKFSKLFGYIETDCGFPKNLTDLKEKASTYLYVGATGFSELAKWCNHFNLSQSDFEDYKHLYQSEKKFESVPYVRIEIGDYTFSKLAHNDVRGALLGLFTKCCQHLSGAGSSCARHGVTDPTSGFYVVEYKKKIVAQSWAWRSKKSDLVFDSIEALSGYDLNTISNLFLQAGQKMIGRLCIDRVLVGSTSYGLTSQIRSFLQNEGHACSNGLSEEMRSSCSYMDGSSQWLLTETGNKPLKFKKVDLATSPQLTNQPNCNILVQGSGVFCEHCDAEVNPDCEICPECHENTVESV